MKFKPLHDRLLLKPTVAETKTKAGIIIPDTAQEKPMQGEVVAVADVASEQRLAVGLAKILPGVPVVGEEAVERDPGLVDLIARPDERCWVVDPLDGTSNFAGGRDRFAMIVCLIEDRQT